MTGTSHLGYRSLVHTVREAVGAPAGAQESAVASATEPAPASATITVTQGSESAR
jgi:hypothetical protein